MNKKLVAAALGLAFAAPVFADSSNVTLYGRVHQAIVNQSVDAAAAGAAVAAGSNFALEDYASRLGVRGSEDLGGGLSVIFAYELAVNSDNSRASGLGTSRHSYLGMKGAWGTFTAGQLDGGNDSVAPLYSQAEKYLGSANNNAGDLANVGGTTTAAPGAAGNGSFTGAAVAIQRTQRTSNSFGYKGNIAGVELSARHAMNGANDGQNSAVGRENDFRETEIAANYKIGALEIGAGYQDVSLSQANETAANVAGGAIESVFQVGAKYTFGALTVGGLYGQVEFGRFPVAANAGRDDSNGQYALSATYALNSNSGLYGFYGSSERENIARDAEVTQYQIAYYYDFSKRTRTYVGYNNASQEQGVNAAGVSNGPDLDTKSFVIGMRHNF
jgi:predicted porin